MTEKSISDQFTFVHEFDSNYRGKYLIQATLIENLIDEILGYHFCPDNKINREMLIATIVNGLTFNTKINNFLKILKNQHTKLHKSNPKLKKQLENLRDLRNKFAHSTPDFTQSFLEKKTDYVRLTFYKNGKQETQDISFSFIRKRLAECSKMVFELTTIFEVVSKRKAVWTKVE